MAESEADERVKLKKNQQLEPQSPQIYRWPRVYVYILHKIRMFNIANAIIGKQPRFKGIGIEFI
jgi:hypothetical protein